MIGFDFKQLYYNLIYCSELIKSSTMRESTSFSSTKKIVRDTYAQHVKQIEGFNRQKLKLQKIYAINFGDDAMIVVSKRQLIIYSILTMKLFYSKEGLFWDAVLIPNTSNLAYVQFDERDKSKRTLKILNLQDDKNIAQIIVKFEIQSIKANQGSICIVGINQLSVIHYPTFKPIFYEVAGSGLKIVYDISFNGLTIAYQTQQKGQVIVHNFSSLSTMKAHRKSLASRAKKSVFGLSFYDHTDAPKKVVPISAHKQSICLLRLSPSGSRLATASTKGTIIRVFLTENGKLWEELRVGYELCKILDLNFYEQGNVIACITEKSMVYLFNTKLDLLEQKQQSQKRNYEIYQQKNPKSMFYFLSFFYNNLGNEHPFAFFRLIRPEQNEDENKQNSANSSFRSSLSQADTKKAEKVQKEKEYMMVILQQSQNVEMKQSPSSTNINISNPLSKQGQKRQDFHYDQQIKEIVRQAKNLNEYRYTSEKEKVTRNFSNSSISLSDEGSKKQRTQSKRINPLNRKELYEYEAKVYNTVASVFIGGNNFIWVAKGPYVFQLKYDPFHGGEMYHKQTIKFC